MLEKLEMRFKKAVMKLSLKQILLLEFLSIFLTIFLVSDIFELQYAQPAIWIIMYVIGILIFFPVTIFIFVSCSHIITRRRVYDEFYINNDLLDKFLVVFLKKFRIIALFFAIIDSIIAFLLPGCWILRLFFILFAGFFITLATYNEVENSKICTADLEIKLKQDEIKVRQGLRENQFVEVEFTPLVGKHYGYWHDNKEKLKSFSQPDLIYMAVRYNKRIIITAEDFISGKTVEKITIQNVAFFCANFKVLRRS